MNLQQSRLVSSLSSSFSVAMLIVAISCLAGCTGNETVAGNDVVPEAKPVEKNVQVTQQATPVTTSVATSTSTVDQSPVTKVDVESGPKQICAQFLQMLKDENRIMAEQLMTRTALTTTSQANLQLQPMGSELAKYDLSEPRYATNKQKLAYVDCNIVDQVDGKKSETEITWLVKKEREGWRISGILVEIQAGEPKNLLSFENYADVARIQGTIVDDLPETESVAQQARKDNAELK